MKNKKQKRNLYKSSSNSEMEYFKFAKVAICVVLVLALTYFVTAIVSGEIKFNKKENSDDVATNIQYEEIIVGQMLNRSDNEYYVLLFNFTDTFAGYYISLIDTYTSKDKSLPFHIIDLEKQVNKQYVLEDGEYLIEKPVRLVDFKASNPTLVRIKDKKIVERITGRDNILKFFEKN